MVKGSQNSSKSIIGLFIRYFILLAVALILSFSSVFYDVFLKLTIYPTNFLLNFFYSSSVSGNLILVNSISIEIIPACVAVSAYLLLLVLNLTTPMNAKKRVFSLIFSVASLLIVNILRIFVLSIVLVEKFAYFDVVHKFFWYFLSIVIVVGLWFASVALFKIKEIPVYSDFISLIKSSRYKRKK